MEWTALSFDGNPRALLHIVARAWVIPAVGHRPVGPRPRVGYAARSRRAVVGRVARVGPRVRNWFIQFPVK